MHINPDKETLAWMEAAAKQVGAGVEDVSIDYTAGVGAVVTAKMRGKEKVRQLDAQKFMVDLGELLAKLAN